MKPVRIYYTLDTQCSHNCAGCYLKTQRGFPARSPDAVIEDVSTLKTQGFDVRVTGSNLVRYRSIETVVSVSGQDYLLGDAESISEDREQMRLLRENGIQRIFLTSPLSSHLKGTRVDIGKAVASVNAAGIQPILSYIIGKDNRPYLRAMIDECLGLNIKSMRFMRYMPVLDEDRSSFIPDDDLGSFLSEVSQFRESIPKTQLNIHVHGHFGTWFRREKGPVCFAGENLFIIGMDCNIYPCEFLMYPQYVLGRWDGHLVHIGSELQGLSNHDCKFKQIFCDGKEGVLRKRS